MKLTRHVFAGIAALTAAVWPAGGSAQTQQTPGANAPDAGIRVKVQVVNTPVAVLDSKNRVVLNLKKEDFQILDNRVKQTIEAFDLASEPLSTVLVLETSSRVAPLLPEIRKTAIVFTQTVVGSSGNAAVIAYDKAIHRVQPFSTNQDEIEKAVTSLKPGDASAQLYDAVSDAVVLLRTQPAGRRRVIIVVGESWDTGSSEKFGQMLREAEFANVVIYSVGLSTSSALLRAETEEPRSLSGRPPGTFGLPPNPGTTQTEASDARQYLQLFDFGMLAELAVRKITTATVYHPLEIASAGTGGIYQSPAQVRGIESAMATIGGDLNAQYTLTYEPTKSDRPGYHEIRIEVDRKKVKVRTRPGYYLEAQ